MNLASISIRRPVATIMLLMIVVVVGISSMIGLPLELMPQIEFPVAIVVTNYPNSSPQEVETMVTAPLESSLATVGDLKAMLSYSFEGRSIVAVNFDYDTDMNFATLNMREKIALVQDFLPDSCSQPMVMKMDMNSMPILQIYASSDQLSTIEINNLLKEAIASRFERVSGVASVGIIGGTEEEIRVKFNQEELKTYGLSLGTMAQILGGENINLPSGEVNQGDNKVIVRTLGEFESIQELKNLPIMVSDRSIVRLGDISTIEKDYKAQDSITKMDGALAVGMMISKQSDANTVKVSKDIHKTISKLEKEYPQIKFVVGYDSADFINKSIGSVGQAAILGGIMAMLVTFIFLRNIRTTLIIGISIPTSLLATFTLMDIKGMSLNLVTLCALAVCVGMLVDNAIVVLENISRTRSLMEDAGEAAVKGTEEIFLPVVASTLTTMAVFIPIAASDGITSLMFGDFCWTIVIALGTSLLVAITVIPMLSSKIMRGTVSTEYIRIGSWRYRYKILNRFDKGFGKILDAYEGAIAKALTMRKKVIIVSSVVFITSIGLLFTMDLELLPDSDEGMISIQVELPYGTSLNETLGKMEEVEAHILQVPELNHIALSTNSLNPMSMSDNGEITLTLSPKNKRKKTTATIAEELQTQLSGISGIKVKATPANAISGMFGSHDLSVMIKGKNREDLENLGYGLIDEVKKMEIVSSAELSVREGNPEIQVIIDRNVAAYYGITAYNLAKTLQASLSGSKATELTVDGAKIQVNLSLGSEAGSSLEGLKQILIQGATGQSVPIGQIASFENAKSPTVIGRHNQINYVTLDIDVKSDSINSGSKEVLDFLNSYPMPLGYYFEDSGIYDQMVDAFSSLAKAIVVAIALVFLLLAAQFESLLMSFVVIMAVPFAVTGAFLALFLTGASLSLTSLLGLVLLVGIVVNNSILLVEFIRQNEKTLGINNALIQAGRLRLRPILMSSLTTIVGMIPLSLGFGEGGEILAPMAISIIGGLLASTLVTLILIPVLYSIIYDRGIKKERRLAEKSLELAKLEAMWKEEDSNE